jgi:hypothetical protein
MGSLGLSLCLGPQPNARLVSSLLQTGREKSRLSRMLTNGQPWLEPLSGATAERQIGLFPASERQEKKPP